MNLPNCLSRRHLLLKTVPTLFLVGSVWALGSCGPEARAQGTGVSEYALKAAFVAKLPQFVKWPAGGGSGITIGVLGDDPFGNTLDQLVRVKRSRRVEDLKGCPVIFVAKSERGNLGGILSSVAGANILIVGDSDGFAKQGGAIGLILDGDKVRFEINADAARRCGLRIDPRLLQLATHVINP